MEVTICHMTGCSHNFWYGYITPGKPWKDIAYLLKSGRFAFNTDPAKAGEDPAEYDCEGIDNPGQFETKEELVALCESMGLKPKFEKKVWSK